MKTKVLSWNIGRGDYLEQIRSYLREQNPDIVGLQEVTSRDRDNLAQDLADDLGYDCAYYSSLAPTGATGRGNAVLSRYPIAGSTYHALSPCVAYDGTPTTEPRIAVQVDLASADGTLTVLSTHLSYTAHFAPSAVQTVQIHTLVGLVRDKQKLVLMGDFNALPASDAVRTLSSVLNHADASLSAPTWTMYPHHYQDHHETQLNDRIDYIFTSPDITATSFEVGMSKGASHLPIWAILTTGHA